MSVETLDKEKLQREVDELKLQLNTYDEYISEFTEGFVSDMYSSGILKTIKKDEIQKWLNSPDSYITEINNLMNYYYIVNGDIHQLYELIYCLPKLGFSIKVYDKAMESYTDDLATIDKTLTRTVKHKQLTREILVQAGSQGTVVCTWLGSKRNPYLYVFDNLKYVFPSHREQGEMVAVIDMEWFDNMEKTEREIIFENLKQLKVRQNYERYEKQNGSSDEFKYFKLPVDKTIVIRNNIIKRNQRLGLPQGTQSVFDILHKQKLKDLEVSIANKIITALAVLKMRGKDDNDDKVNEKKKKQVFSAVKKALEKNTAEGGLTVIGIPDFADFTFPEIKNGDKALDPKKFESINSDISSANGVSSVLTNGTGGNFASAKLNLEILYQRIGVLLEQIEEVYNKMFKIILGANNYDNYSMVYEKNMPLSTKEKLDILLKLHNEGFAVKPVIDLVEGVDYQEYIEQSIYEIEILKLRERIIPPALSYTTSGDSDSNSGQPEKDDSDNDNTVVSKENDGNKTPRASV